MTHLLILALAVLQLGDPVADAIGDGSLAPPTAPVYATTSNFDLQGVVLTEDPELTLHVTLGALDNPGGLEFGFSHPVVEIYLDSAPGGAQSLLPGSGLRMPDGQGWESAIRLTGDEAYLVTAQEAGAPGDWPTTPLTLSTEATTLIVRAPLPRPRHAELYAIAGVYDAFSPDAWRAVSATPTPWAFSSPTQTSPVVDVMAPSQAEQVRALRSGVLPRPRAATYGVGWLVLMLVGVAAAIVGILLRRRAGAALARPPAAAVPPAVPAGSPAGVPDGRVSPASVVPAVAMVAVAASPDGEAAAGLDDGLGDGEVDGHSDDHRDGHDDGHGDGHGDAHDALGEPAAVEHPLGSPDGVVLDGAEHPSEVVSEVDGAEPRGSLGALAIVPRQRVARVPESPRPADGGWHSVLVDPHDSFLDEEEEEEAAALWPDPVAAVREAERSDDGGSVGEAGSDAPGRDEPKRGPDLA